MRLNAPQDQTIIGESPHFLEIMDQCSRAAKHDRPVLVIGERGTGKELIAARLHFLSPRWEKGFVQVNCAALPDNLLESELFGHEAGAFTGANAKRIGRFEEAHQGTLFLDEIATTSQSAQEKLLRVTEYGTFQRIGSNRTLETDVRLIGATNIDLPAAADRGEFRHDLLDRLALDVITLPPLRHRREDILLLAFQFGQRVAQELEWMSFPGFSDEMTDALMQHDWPGNIRELKNVIERAVYHAEDEFSPINVLEIDPFKSPFRPGAPATPAAANPPSSAPDGPKAIEPPTRTENILFDGKPLDYTETIATLERKLLVDALESNRHNQRDTAKFLNLTYHQLRHQLKKHELL
ncbi:phage shock protein operon transcriptional activator [Paremcibacter congregatus]|uniref:Phage shock protein operon transcriptional activator n=1 Tax=Paremcibacter congregatus TaxID=2043170 RepID=A0A2G4YP74_9PROT|nr:phage shock protein operon transcriptional activator [Paremcibacter congregatus]PHZ84095.1 phage shock protein operon transcriptional activator [Paremcibacter congregatus]QDE25844.1 phage shock protein operon transcriptional activator [Paremcibacter congregatus]